MFQQKDLSKNRYIIYARKSTESEDRQVASIDDQINCMSKLAKERELNVIRVYSEASSGYKLGREQFGEMVKAIKEGKADGILCWKLSRLSRNPDDAGTVMGMIQRNEVKHIRTIDKDWFPEDNVMMMYVEFGITNQYSRDLSTDTKRGTQTKAERGWYPSANLDIGYMHNRYKKLGDREILCDENFPVIKECLKRISSEELTPVEAKDWLDKKGFRTRKGKKISSSTFYNIVSSVFYAGKFYWNGQEYEGKHEKAITWEEHLKIISILKKNTKIRFNVHEFPFSGLVICGECKRSIVGIEKLKKLKNGEFKRYIYYNCSKHDRHCSQRPIKGELLENQMQSVINRINIPKEFHEWAIKQLKKKQEKELVSNQDYVKLNQRNYNDLVGKIDKLIRSYLDEKIPEDFYTKELDRLQKEKESLKTLLDASDKGVNEFIDKVDEVMNFSVKAKERFESGDIMTRKKILKYIGCNFSLMNGKLVTELQKPFEMVSEVNDFIHEDSKAVELVEKLINSKKKIPLDLEIPVWGS